MDRRPSGDEAATTRFAQATSISSRSMPVSGTPSTERTAPGIVIGAPVGYLVLPLARPLASPDSMYPPPNPELAWAVTMGTSAAKTTLFITGGLAPLLHGALRVVVAAASPLPLRLTPWLDALARRDLLHRVGGGWVFRHATFRARLAGR